MKILIAEDNKISRLLLASALKKQEHEVVATENGSEAFEAFQTDYFPVLILDWMMPGMDGLEVCRRVRNLLPENYTYIVLLTSLEGKSKQTTIKSTVASAWWLRCANVSGCHRLKCFLNSSPRSDYSPSAPSSPTTFA